MSAAVGGFGRVIACTSVRLTTMWGRRGRKKDATGDASGDLSTLLLEGEDMLRQVEEAHRTWGLGTADRWNLDQQSGLLTWTFPDKAATARAQILGSHSANADTWLWSWANQSILAHLTQAAEEFCDWATTNGHADLAEPKLEADRDKAATLATLAFRVTRGTGFYRAPGASTLYMTFGPVELHPRDGESSTFKIQID